MPGAIPHLVAASAMFLIGIFYFKNYFKGKDKLKEKLLLAFICLNFTFIPDVILIIYYLTRIYPKEIFEPYQILFVLILIPISIVSLIIIKYVINTKKEPIWIMGFLCILLHITMDSFIEEINVWI